MATKGYFWAACVALAGAFVPGCNAVTGVGDYQFDRACADAITATTEDCSTPEDENCDGILQCSADWHWDATFGRTGEQVLRAVTFDDERNVIVAGNFAGQANVLENVFATKGGNDIFVAKINPAGKLIWAQRYGLEGEQIVYDVAADREGNIVLVGSYDGKVTFGGDPLTATAGRDLFIAKLNPSGAHLWSRSVGGGGDQLATSIKIDAGNNLFMAGHFTGDMDFGIGGSQLSSMVATTNDIFIAKLKPSGEHVWSYRYGDGSDQVASTIALGKGGRFYVSGLFQGSIGGLKSPETLASSGMDDGFLIAFQDTLPDPTVEWAKRFGDDAGSASRQEVTSIATDRAGNVVVAGYFEEAVAIGEGLAAKGMGDIFVAKFGLLGEHIWSIAYGSTEPDAPTALVVDGADNVVLTGSIVGPVDFGGEVKPGGAMLSNDVFLAKWDGNNVPVTATRFTYDGPQHAYKMAVDRLGNLAIVGVFQGTVNFGGDGLVGTTMTLNDAFLAVFRP
jgi:hypothetical protein